MHQRPRRRQSVALALSVVLHVVFLLFLAKSRPASMPSMTRSQTIAISMIEVPAPVRAPAKTPDAPSRQATAPARPRPAGAHRPEATPLPSSEAPSPPSGPAHDSPQVATLTPTLRALDRLGTAAAEPESHGQTIHNSPDELPDAESLRAETESRVRGRVQGMLDDDSAGHRVDVGAVDGYFGELKDALAQSVAHPPPFFSGSVLNSKDSPLRLGPMLQAWQAQAQQYGATGSPYASAGAQGGVSPNSRAAQAFDDAAAYRERLEGHVQLMAVVELHQAADGKLKGLLMLQASGNREFDRYVMASAPLALNGLASPPDAGAGLHADGIRTQWAFEGKVELRRKLKDVDGKYLANAPLALLGLMGGTFEETTGEIQVADFANPQFTCAVRLLRVY